MSKTQDLSRMAAYEFKKRYGHLETHWLPEQWNTLREMFIAGASWRNKRVQVLRKALDGTAPWHHELQKTDVE